MNAIELELDMREEVGSSASRRLRREGFVPAVIYSGGDSSTNLKINKLTLGRQTKGAGRAQLYTIKSAVKELDGELALIKDMDIDPLRQEVIHLDLLHITAGVRITVEVPVELEGVPADVKSAIAVVEQPGHEIEIECLPREIPSKIVVQIGSLELGDSIHAGEVQLPEGAVLKTKSDALIAAVVPKRVEKEEPAAAEGAEGAEAADAAAAPAKESKE